MEKLPIIIIGAGPAGLMAAQRLAELGETVHIYEKNKAAARKFLVAGHGGFNLTHSEDINSFVKNYDKKQIQDIVQYFDNNKTVEWLNGLGIPTYKGSSGKIFPEKHIKPIEVLRAWLEKLKILGVKIFYEHNLKDFNIDSVQLSDRNNTIITQKYSSLIMALGGGSWAKTGSDAKWIDLLATKGINITELESANSGYNTSYDFSSLEAQTLKNITVNHQHITKKGELVFTNYGIEGSAIYFLNRFTRQTAFPLTIQLDLKPNLSKDDILRKVDSSKNISKSLKENLNITGTPLSLLKILPKEIYTTPQKLVKYIKEYPIEVTSLRPIDEVISTSGGISFEELEENLSLKRFPNVYTIGEMVDWEAPTGGYLLQACFSMGQYVADNIVKK